MISASDQQIEDLKSILKTTTTSERNAKSDLTHAIKDMNELKNEVKIQASMAAKAELHSQVYNQLVQAKDEIIGNQKEIINQMKINCQFQELNNYENISTPIRSDTKDKQDKSHSHVQDGTISLENNQTSENKQQHLTNSNSEGPIQHLLEEKEHNQNKIAKQKVFFKYQKGGCDDEVNCKFFHPKEPCTYFNSPKGCKFGIRCRFNHSMGTKTNWNEIPPRFRNIDRNIGYYRNSDFKYNYENNF